MPRIAVSRLAAEPSSPRQKARQGRILSAAADLAAENGLERVQMHDVAGDAGVAIATLYRYFPSKTHLFTAVLAERVERLVEAPPAVEVGVSPAEAVAELLVRASRSLVTRPLLAMAMLQSNAVADATTVPDAGRIDTVFGELVLRTLGVAEASDHDITLVRLLVRCWYGVLTASLNGRMSLPDAESDIRVACAALLGHYADDHDGGQQAR